MQRTLFLPAIFCSSANPHAIGSGPQMSMSRHFTPPELSAVENYALSIERRQTHKLSELFGVRHIFLSAHAKIDSDDALFSNVILKRAYHCDNGSFIPALETPVMACRKRHYGGGVA